MSDDQYRVRKRSASEYREDEQNANKGTRRGQRMIETSYRLHGAGRSWLVDKDDTLIAGNHARRGALAAGVDDVIEIEVLDPNVQVVVKRPDLDLDNEHDVRARGLAYTDNRAGETSLDWDAQTIREDEALLRELELFRDDEFDDLFAQADVEAMIEQSVGHVDDRQMYKTLEEQRGQTLKIVLHMPDGVALVERAISAAKALTGSRNREQLMLTICQYFIDAHTDAELEAVHHDADAPAKS